jgi:diacylglycerol O-acyltransferase / wax synthase
VKRLNGMDAMLLYSEAPNLPMHTLKAAVVSTADFDGEFSYETFRRTLQRRMHLLDPLRYRLVDIPWRLHHPMWLENCDVDLDYHVRRVQVGPPGGRRELDEVIAQIMATPLDRGRPLWEFHFAEGMADGRYAVIGKVHHALADGVAAVNLLARAMDLVGSASDERDDYPRDPTPSDADLIKAAARDHLQQIAELPGLVREGIAGSARVRRLNRERGEQPAMAKVFNAPPTFLNHVVSPVRTFASAALALADIKETAKALGVTINDLVLAISTGAMRELLLRYDGHADEPIVASVPISTDRSPDRISGNEISGLPVSLPVHIDDPVERIRVTALSAANAKEDNDIRGPELIPRAMGYLPSAFAPPAFRWLAERDTHNTMMNVPVSNVPGPRERGHFGGAPVTEIYSTGVLSPGVGINITVWSYVELLCISILADDQTCTDVHEVTDAMSHAFVELRLAAGLPGELRPLENAMPAAAARA